MTEKVKYEPVPLDKLQEYERFHAESNTPAPSTDTGSLTLGAGAAYEIGGRIPYLNRVIPEAYRPGYKPTGVPTPTGAPHIPTTVAEFYDPFMVSEHGLGPGGTKNRLHNFDQDIGAELNKKWLANPEPGYSIEGNRRFATPNGPDTSYKPKSWEIPPPPPEPPPPPPKKPTSIERLKKMGTAVADTLQPATDVINKYGKIAGPVFTGLGYYGLGTHADEAYRRFKHGDVGRGLVDVGGAIGDLAALRAPHIGVKILGEGASLGSDYLNKKLDEKYGRNYAVGGLVHLAEGGQPKKPNDPFASQVGQNQFSVHGIPLKPSDDESYQSWWTDASKQNDMNRYTNAMLPSKDLNISNPSYLKGVESITNYPGGHITGQFGFYRPFVDGTNINVTSDLNENEAPYVTGHEAQHLQDRIATFNQWRDEKNYSFLDRLNRNAAKTNPIPHENQIEKNYQDYVKKWKKEADEDPNRNHYGHSKIEEELGNYYDRTPGFHERFADFAGLEAALPRGTRLADTPLGKAVFNTPELQNYYNLNVRPLENKAIAGHSPTSPTADGIRKIKAALQYHFNNTGESYADALINGIKDTFKK